MTYQSIFVAKSCVRDGDDIRLLLHEDNDHNDFDYICSMKPPEDFSLFFKGFVEKGKSGAKEWDMTRVYEAKMGIR